MSFLLPIVLLFFIVGFSGCARKPEPESASAPDSALDTSVESPAPTVEVSAAPAADPTPDPAPDVPPATAKQAESGVASPQLTKTRAQVTPLSMDEGEVMVQSPEPLNYFAPFYPLSKRMEGAEGQVVLQFVIDRSGRVVNPSVSASTVPDFNEFALQAVRDWRFLPALIDGKPVDIEVSYPVTFASEKGSLGAQAGSVFSRLDLIFDTYYIKGADGYELAEFEVTPIYRQVPSRPRDDEGNLISGRVSLTFSVSEEGRVENAKVTESTATELELPALTAIRYWQFIPRIREGKPVRAGVQQSIAFKSGEGG